MPCPCASAASNVRPSPSIFGKLNPLPSSVTTMDTPLPDSQRHRMCTFLSGFSRLPCTTAFPSASRIANSTSNSAPGTHFAFSINRIIRSTSGEIASILLGIQQSISRIEERECFPENFGWEYSGWEFGASFRPRIPFMTNASVKRNASHGPKPCGVTKLAELIDFQCDGELEDRSVDQAARGGSASQMVGCQFPGVQKRLSLPRAAGGAKRMTRSL